MGRGNDVIQEQFNVILIMFIIYIYGAFPETLKSINENDVLFSNQRKKECMVTECIVCMSIFIEFSDF